MFPFAQTNKLPIWTMQSYPSPNINNSNACKKLSNSSWFCDPDSIISTSDEISIEAKIMDIRNRTNSSCICNSSYEGFRFGVAIAARTCKDGRSKKDFANGVREVIWKLSTDPILCDDSVLMMLFVQEQHVSIATGLKARKLLPDGAVKAITGGMRNHLKRHRYGPALLYGATESYLYLSKQKVYKKPGKVICNHDYSFLCQDQC